MALPTFENSDLFITAKVRGVMVKNGKIFLCKLSKAGFCCLPGGTLERGETRLEGLRREFIEELGVEPVIGPLIYTQELTRSNGLLTFDFWYAVTNVDDFENVDLSKCSHGFESEEAGFYDLADIVGEYKPGNLPKLLSVWNESPLAFVQSE